MKIALTCHIFLIINVLQAQTISLDEAIRENLVSVKIEGTGGFSGQSLKITLANIAQKRLKIGLKPGFVMACEDTTRQDLLLVDGSEFNLSPKEKKELLLVAYCCKMRRGGPGVGQAFRWAGRTDEKLAKTATFLFENGLNNSSMAQNAVWAVSDKADLSAIYDRSNKEKSKKLIEFVAELTGQKVPWYRSEYKKTPPGPEIIKREMLKIHADWDFNLEKDDVLTFAIFDSGGKQVKTFFADKNYLYGKYSFSFSYETNKLPKGKYFFRMVGVKSGLVAERILEI